MTVYVMNVTGDGHCFFRCIYRIVRDVPYLRPLFHLAPEKERGECEDAAVGRVRASVALAFLPEQEPHLPNHEYLFARNALMSLTHMRLVERVPGLDALYPLLRYCNEVDFDAHCTMDTLYAKVKDTDMYASSIEVDVAKTRFASRNVYLAVISQDAEIDADKWLSDIVYILHSGRDFPQRRSLFPARIAILVNAGNEHFKYLRFHGSNAPLFMEFAEYIQGCIDMDSDSGTSDSDGQ